MRGRGFVVEEGSGAGLGCCPMKKICGSLSLLLTGVCFCGGQEDYPVQVIDEFVVSAAAVIQGNDVNVFGGGVTVVGARQLADLGALDISGALRMTPGVTVSRFDRVGSYGGAGGGGIFVRGMGASRPGGELVTLVDGAPRYNAVFSHPLLDILSVDSADSVRVFKGAQPQFFGNAFAAVDMVPRRAGRGRAGDKLPSGSGVWEADVSVAAGADETFVEKFSAGGRQGAVDFLAGQSWKRSEGHRRNAGGELQDYFLRGGWEINGRWDFSVFLDRTKNFAEDPGDRRDANGFHMGDYRTDDWFGVATLANRGGGLSGFVKVYWNRGHAEWLDQGMAGSGASPVLSAARDTVMDWDLFGVRAREEFALWGGGSLSAGADVDVAGGEADFSTYTAGSGSRFERESFWIFSPFAGVSQLVDLGGVSLRPSAGVRFYEHEVFGSAWSPHAGIVGSFTGAEVHVSWARGVVFPGLNVAALSPNRGAWSGLEEESVDHFEAAVSRVFGKRARVEASVFWDEGRNRYVRTAGGFENISSWRNRGVEACVSVSPFAGVSVFAGGTWLDCSVEGMPYAPEWSASAGVAWQVCGRLRVCADALYQGAMFVNAANGFARSGSANPAANERVGPAFVVNVRASWAFEWAALGVRRGEVFAAVENLTDCDYEYRPGYPMPGIGWMFGVKVGW